METTRNMNQIIADLDAMVRESYEGYEPKPAVVKFDRAEHCRRIAQSGGFATSMIYGSDHMSRIGKIGYAVTKQKLGAARTQELVRGKGWKRPQVSSFRADMEAVGL